MVRSEMPPPQQELIHRHHFSDFDVFTHALAKWQLEFNQLDHGKFSGNLEQLRTKHVIIERAQLNRKIEQKGVAPPNCRTFAIPNLNHTPYNWRGKHIASNKLISFASEIEMHSVSAPGFDLFAASISNETLTNAAKMLGYESHESILEREHVVNLQKKHLHSLRHFLTSIFQTPSAPARSRKAITHELESDLPILLLKIFTSEDKKQPAPSLLSRRRALSLARDVIENAEEPITSVYELCQLSGMGERNLRYAFMDEYGIPPKAYLHVRRLNTARRILRNAPTALCIADVANQQGFWHMGQFAADYRKMFGELPSETLKACY